MSSKPISGLAHIDARNYNPFELFHEWYEEASKYLPTANNLNIMNLATCTKDGSVSNRNVQVLRYEPDGFVFITDTSSRKVQEIRNNPHVATTFLWRYSRDKCDTVTKQVRIHGSISEMSTEYTRDLFNSLPTCRKIRYHVIEQGKVVDWNNIKEIHQEILEEVKNGRILEMPPYVVSYKLSPSGMEFYYDSDNFTADRVLFTRQGDEWTFVHLSA